MFTLGHKETNSHSTPEIRECEAEIVRLNRSLKATSQENKVRLTELRGALWTAEDRLKNLHRKVKNSPEVIVQNMERELSAARAKLARLEKDYPGEKALLSDARIAVRDLESRIKSLKWEHLKV